MVTKRRTAKKASSKRSLAVRRPPRRQRNALGDHQSFGFGFSTLPKLVIGGLVAGGAALLYLLRDNSYVQQGEALVANGISSLVSYGSDTLFSNALPGSLSQWAPQMLSASRTYGVSPWLLAGLMYRESSGGATLRPAGPTGTGDFTARAAGKQYKQTSGAYYTVPSNGLPEDGQGWGRGLMQIDWGVWNEWCRANNWQDAQTNINKAAEIFKSGMNYFSSSAAGLVGGYPDPRPLDGDELYAAALAAYNAGPSRVLAAISSGQPAESVTSGGDYVTWLMSRVSPWMQAFSSAGGV